VADQSLDIVIKTLADKHGAEEVRRALDGITDATKQSTVVTEAHGKAVHELESQHRLLHTAMHKLTEESPLLGVALRSALSPTSAVIIGMVTAFSYLTKAQKEAEKAAKEMAAALTKSLEDSQESANKATATIAGLSKSFDDWLAGLSQKMPSATAQLDKQLTVLNSMKDAYAALAKLQGVSPEKLAGAETAAALDLTQKAATKTAVDLASAEKRAVTAQAKLTAGGTREFEIDELEKIVRRLEARAAASGGRLGEAIGREARGEREVREAPNEEQRRLAQAGVGIAKADIAKAREENQKDAALAATARAELQSLVKAREADGRELKQAKEDVDRLTKSMGELTQKVSELQQKIQGQKAAETVAGFAPGTIGGIVAAGASNADKDAALQDLLTSLGANNPVMISLLRKNAGDIDFLTKEIRLLEARSANPSTRTLPGSG
jgi:hypothetical protein